jgi:hypothetical protein
VRSFLKQAVLRASRKARAKRGELFRRLLPVSPEDKVLDLGGDDGAHIAAILPEHRNIWVADIDPRALEKASQRGFHTVLIESHTWLPSVILLLPRHILIRLINWLNRFWIKPTEPDWNLLSIREMRELFPEAELYIEWWFGLPKSLIACKR